jgi:diguanylate cyclase (GGDEF)-like protein
MKMIERNGETFERKTMTKAAVETYAPIVSGDIVFGVLEIYSDITLQRDKLNGVVRRSFAILFLMAATLLVLTLYSTRRAGRFLRERQRMEEELRTLSISDELTGLYNRRGFFAFAEQQTKIAKRMKQGVLLVSADLNDMKKINDGFGHHEGDLALKDTADILRKSFRESDIIARIGGDEFAVLMMEKQGIDREVLSARLDHNLEQHNAGSRRSYALSISTGIVSCGPECDVPLEDLMKRADLLMYEQKRNKPER